MTEPARSARPALGVVVVHFGPPRTTLACLRSVAADPSAAGRSVVVVDNSANLGAIADDIPPGTRVLSCPENPGFGAGANRGVAALTGEDVAGYVILNGDVELLPGYLDAALQALADGAAAAAGPLYLDAAGGPLWYAGGGLNPLTGTLYQSRSPARARRRRTVGFLPGSALAVSADAWRACGGFDPGFFLYHEDLDLCLRLRRAGRQLRFEPRMQAVHHLGAATGSHQRSPLYLENLTRTRLRPHRPRIYRLYLAALHTGWVMLRSLSLLATQGRGGVPRVRALLRGHRDALAGVWRGKGPEAEEATGEVPPAGNRAGRSR